MAKYKLSEKSLSRLEGVDESLVKMIKQLIKVTPVDFSVIEGLRTVARQQKLFRFGKSKIDPSKGMVGKHTIGKAVDIYPWVDGKTSHSEEHYFAIIAEAKKLGLPFRWGGSWHVPDLTATDQTPEESWDEYVARKEAAGKKTFKDFPHIEIA